MMKAADLLAKIKQQEGDASTAGRRGESGNGKSPARNTTPPPDASAYTVSLSSSNCSAQPIMTSLSMPSKATVGEYIGVDERTVLRRTQALVKAGWLMDTGERKQWDAGNWTPVYRINVEKFVTDCQIDRGVGDNLSGRGGCQNVIQGSGSRSSSVSPSSSQAGAEARATGLRPEVGKSAPPQPTAETENQKPRTNGKSNPNPRSCPKCGEAWSRDENHICTTSSSRMDTEFDDMGMPPSRLDNWEEL
jgi:hypothetical protein